MSQNTPPPVRRAQRPPRLDIKTNAPTTSSSVGVSARPSTAQPTYTGQTNNTIPGAVDESSWQQYANPFGAGNFMSKGFDGFVDFTKSGMSFGEKFTYGLYDKFSKWSKKWFTHIFLALVLMLYSLGGAWLFSEIETSKHSKLHKEIVHNQTIFFDTFRSYLKATELREDHPEDFKQINNFTLENKDLIAMFINSEQTYEELLTEKNPWTFWESVFFCASIYTTIGYGHIAPKTIIGRSLSIAYAVIGIPMFLIVLTDFGKLFTRCLKFIWAYVRRIYYTGTCRKIRHQQQIQDAMSGLNTVYDYFGGGDDDDEPDIESKDTEQEKPPGRTASFSHSETPTSMNPEAYVVDDDFNLPISVASFLLISYILIGTIVYANLEEWDWVQSFYFVFISMSTIGFGDLVPSSALVKNCSIVYFIFGLALTSMFINVVQIKLSNSFKQATTKISATIGLVSEMNDGDDGEEDSEVGTQIKTPPTEITAVHKSSLGKNTEGERETAGTPKLISILRRPTSPTPYTQNEQSNNGEDVVAPSLPPRRKISIEPPVEEKKKKRRFFKK